MQKDVHYYLTHALALKAGLTKPKAKMIAWANQFTDDLTEPEVYEIQTQCGIAGDWYDMKTQFSVLIPFHFMPGTDLKWPWKTTENCPRAINTADLALQSKDLLQIGIALHTLQDTFSHQNFSGWREDRNSCYPWYHMTSIAPNVGHTEMRHKPDDASLKWKDPRTNKQVNNPARVKRAAKATFQYLCKYANTTNANQLWQQIAPLLDAALKEKDYDDRKKKFNAITGVNAPRYKKITDKMEDQHKEAFITAATKHLAAALKSMDGLPR